MYVDNYSVRNGERYNQHIIITQSGVEEVRRGICARRRDVRGARIRARLRVDGGE